MSQINFIGGVSLNNCTIGNNNSIINIEPDSKNQKISFKTETFDERKSVSGRLVEEILIDASIANVNISSSDLPNIQVYLHGQVLTSGKADFDFLIENHVLKITLNVKGEYRDDNLKLDVSVPKNKVFEVISVDALSSNINLGKDVSTNYINVDTMNGNLETSATFANASLSTYSGNVSLHIDAKENISVKVSAMSGNVSAKFNNIVYINPSCLHATFGSIKNYHKGGSGYNADVSISTMVGNILVE